MSSNTSPQSEKIEKWIVNEKTYNYLNVKSDDLAYWSSFKMCLKKLWLAWKRGRQGKTHSSCPEECRQFDEKFYLHIQQIKIYVANTKSRIQITCSSVSHILHVVHCLQIYHVYPLLIKDDNVNLEKQMFCRNKL